MGVESPRRSSKNSDRRATDHAPRALMRRSTARPLRKVRSRDNPAVRAPRGAGGFLPGEPDASINLSVSSSRPVWPRYSQSGVGATAADRRSSERSSQWTQHGGNPNEQRYSHAQPGDRRQRRAAGPCLVCGHPRARRLPEHAAGDRRGALRDGPVEQASTRSTRSPASSCGRSTRRRRARSPPPRSAATSPTAARPMRTARSSGAPSTDA